MQFHRKCDSTHKTLNALLLFLLLTHIFQYVIESTLSVREMQKQNMFLFMSLRQLLFNNGNSFFCYQFHFNQNNEARFCTFLCRFRRTVINEWSPTYVNRHSFQIKKKSRHYLSFEKLLEFPSIPTVRNFLWLQKSKLYKIVISEFIVTCNILKPYSFIHNQIYYIYYQYNVSDKTKLYLL